RPRPYPEKAGFRGECAAASLKLELLHTRRHPQRVFPRRMRRGLIEAVRPSRRRGADLRFPRRMRRGLIEARSSCTRAVGTRSSFRGECAAASLKRDAQHDAFCIAPISLDTKVSDTCRVPKEKRRDGKEVDIERRA